MEVIQTCNGRQRPWGSYTQTWHRNGEMAEERGHVTDLITNEAVEWIKTRKTPWFCHVPFTAVHTPIKSTQRWLDQYAYGKYGDDSQKDEFFKRYAGYASHMDNSIGRIVESQDKSRQRDNTIILFSSDNGAVSGARLHASDRHPGWQDPNHSSLGSNLPFLLHKAQLYEGGIRTPTLINWRGQLNPGRMDHPVHVSDWMPTFTGLLNIQPASDPKWDGKDIWPLLTGASNKPEPRDIYWNFNAGKGFCIRSGDWKLISSEIEGSDERKLELFNISEDPYETIELADQNNTKVEELVDRLRSEFSKDYVDMRPDIGNFHDATNWTGIMGITDTLAASMSTLTKKSP